LVGGFCFEVLERGTLKRFLKENIFGWWLLLQKSSSVPFSPLHLLRNNARKALHILYRRFPAFLIRGCSDTV
jgi:hypothetical protein